MIWRSMTRPLSATMNIYVWTSRKPRRACLSQWQANAQFKNWRINMKEIIRAHFECDRTCTLFQECRFTPILRQIGRTRVFSHVTKEDVEIRDLDALPGACAQRGLSLRLGQTSYKWW